MESTTEAEEAQFDDLQSLLSRPSFRLLTPLDDAIDIYKRLTGLTIITDIQRESLHFVLSDLLQKRYHEKRLLADLNDAITFTRLLPSNDGGHVETLGVLLYERFLRKQAIVDIDESIQIFQKAIDATEHIDLQSVKLLNRLATCFYARFHIAKSKDDLDTSISMTTKAIQIANSPDAFRTKIMLQHDLAARLAIRYEVAGDAQDLEQATNTNHGALVSLRDDDAYRAPLLVNRARIAFTRFKRSYFWKDLDEAKHAAKEATDLRSTDPLTRIVIHQNLAVFHLQSFEIGKIAVDLMVARQNAISAVTQSEKMKLHVDATQETLFQCYQAALLQTGEMAELQGLMDVLENQIDRLPKQSPRCSKREQYLNLLGLKFQHTGDHADLVFLCHEALQSLRDGSQGTNDEPDAAKERLIDALSYLLGEIYRYLLIPEFFHVRDGFITALYDEFVKYKHEGALGALKSILTKCEVLSFRTNRYARDRETRGEEAYNHITKIAGCMERARLKARTESDPSPLTQFRFRMMDLRLSMPKGNEGEKISVQDARDALLLSDGNQDIKLLEEDPATNAPKNHQLSKALLSQAGQFGPESKTAAASALVEALSYARKAIDGFPAENKDRLDALVTYVTICQMKDEFGQEYAATNEELIIVESALDVLPQSQSTLVLQLQLCQIRRFRYLRTQEVDDIDRAMALAETFVFEDFINAEFRNEPYWFERVSIACQVFRTRYQQLSDSAALDRGISILRKALRYAEAFDTRQRPNDSNLVTSMGTLGSMLRHRFRQTGAFRDLQEAATHGRRAVRIIEDKRMPRGLADAIKNNVSLIIEDLFKRTKKLEDLQEAIGLVESVQGRSQLTGINLANMLHERFMFTKEFQDLKRAVSIAQAAVNSKADWEPYLEVTYGDASEILLTMFNQTQETQYLDEALTYADIASREMKEEGPWMTNHLVTHGEILLAKARLLGTFNDELRERSISTFLRAWKNISGNTAARIAAARRAAELYCTRRDWVSAYRLLKAAVEFLSELSPPWLDHRDRQDLIKNLSGLAVDAAMVALKERKTAYQALRLLELGRSIIMGSSIDVRSDISHLGDVNPELERQFNRLRMALDTSSEREDDPFKYRNKGVNGEDYQRYGKQIKLHEPETRITEDERKAVFEQMKSVLVSIRQQPGLEDFLQPPTEDRMLKLAHDGPIVFVLCSQIVDETKAIIVQATGLHVLDLPAARPAEITGRLQQLRGELLNGPLRTYAARSKKFRGELVWLWDVIVEPILSSICHDFRDKFPQKKPHVRWIGVGAFNCVPFHAAGEHDTGATNNAINHIISSYSTSLRALQYVKEPNSRSNQLDRLYIATMENTIGCPPLPSVTQEMSSISSIASDFIAVATNPAPTPKEVLDQLPHHNLLHFACHGISDASDPFNSRLLLNKPSRYYGDKVTTSEPLSVRGLLTSRSPRADLAYISACSSADNQVGELADEAVHIASGFQLAGFRNVVASLWSQKDKVCLSVAELFYRELFRLREERNREGGGEWPVAEALHNAVVEFRERKPDMVLQWASFVHIGG
ncbi:hypothetical protein P154DRAFT_522026 [Amniculicola lignicola CBS 123094]|uniref:CHAT domain-containing protein n=1 Tax=Amniculicola lignicola CBS 123094 TaxID=1392246 RepID=A0A6A5WHB2_9PLEO|nr:hypothetical protein P154DRAFT_522026 [Amniculicola lignicola CBS 123094]